jgi:hypothetical protein
MISAGTGPHDARGAGRRGTVRDFFWQGDGIRASRSSMSQNTAGAGRRDKGVAHDAVPDLVRCPRDGPCPRRGRARRGQGRALGGPGGHKRRRVRVRRRAGRPAGEHRGHRRAVTDGPYPQAIGGFTLLDVPSREEALRWAAKIAVACRCAQEVREIGADPELDAMLRQADSRR